MSFNVHNMRALCLKNTVSADQIALQKFKQHVETLVRRAAEQGQQWTSFSVQVLALDCPAFNRDVVTRELEKWLKSAGFNVKITEYMLNIDWIYTNDKDGDDDEVQLIT